MALNRYWAATSLGTFFAVPVFFVVTVFLVVPVARAQSPEALLNLPDAPSALLQQQSLPPSPPPVSTSPESSSSQNAPAPTVSGEQKETSQDQLKEQEKQRVLGVMASFNTTSNHDALPLTAGQKFQLFFKSATDPWPFGLAAFSAGIDQAEDSFPEYGQGIEGYAKRFGADYTDYFTGNFFGNAVFTSWWHEDPRYFQKGTGTKLSRALWAASSTVWCKRDNGGWGPNYANVIGNLVGSAISNVYYPASDRTVVGTFERGFTVSAEGIFGAEVIEFYPDFLRRHRRKKAEKQAREAAQHDAQNTAQPSKDPAQVPPPAATPQKPQN